MFIRVTLASTFLHKKCTFRADFMQHFHKNESDAKIESFLILRRFVRLKSKFLLNSGCLDVEKPPF